MTSPVRNTPYTSAFTPVKQSPPKEQECTMCNTKIRTGAIFHKLYGRVSAFCSPECLKEANFILKRHEVSPVITGICKKVVYAPKEK